MELDHMTTGGLHAYPAPRGGPAAKPNVILQIGKCRAEMLEHVRRTHRHLLTEVSKQVERELKGLHRSVGKLENNLDGYVPTGDSQRWKKSIKACLCRCRKLKRFLRHPLPKTLEQLIQRGMEVQDGLEQAAEPSGTPLPTEDETEALTPALTSESVASDRTQPE